VSDGGEWRVASGAPFAPARQLASSPAISSQERQIISAYINQHPKRFCS